MQVDCARLTPEAERLALRRIEELGKLRNALEADGLLDAWQMGIGEAKDALTAVGLGLHRRYRYDVLVVWRVDRDSPGYRAGAHSRITATATFMRHGEVSPDEPPPTRQCDPPER